MISPVESVAPDSRDTGPAAVENASEPLDSYGFPIRGTRLILLRKAEKARKQATAKPQVGPGSEKFEGVLNGLRELCAVAKPEHQHSAAEIARACNCSEKHIQNIEQSAKRKMRARLGPILGKLSIFEYLSGGKECV